MFFVLLLRAEHMITLSEGNVEMLTKLTKSMSTIIKRYGFLVFTLFFFLWYLFSLYV